MMPSSSASPRTAFAEWTLSHKFQLPSSGRLSSILDAMPLPNIVKKVLRDSIYIAPEDGLFICTSAGSSLSIACRRDDVVEMLLKHARSLQHTVVALVHGLRRTGKTFSMPWAQLEAIRILESNAGRVDQSLLSTRRRNVMIVECHQVTPMDLDHIPVLLAAVVGRLRCDLS